MQLIWWSGYYDLVEVETGYSYGVDQKTINVISLESKMFMEQLVIVIALFYQHL